NDDTIRISRGGESPRMGTSTMSLSVENGIGSEEHLTGRVGAEAPAKKEQSDNGMPAPAKPWSIAESAKLYGIQSWGQGYFSINGEGNVATHPTQDPHLSIDLKKLVDELRGRDIGLPILVRFTDILRHRVKRIHEAFSSAIKDNDYKGGYRCVYPIKVNQ